MEGCGHDLDELSFFFGVNVGVEGVIIGLFHVFDSSLHIRKRDIMSTLMNNHCTLLSHSRIDRADIHKGRSELSVFICDVHACHFLFNFKYELQIFHSKVDFSLAINIIHG